MDGDVQKREGNKILDSRWTNQKEKEERASNGKGNLGSCLLNLEGTLVLNFNGGPS